MNKEKIQKVLEKEACKRNGGMCESYEYCRFCTEPKEMYRNSITPCADALLDLKDINTMLKNYMSNKAKIATINDRIETWNRALEDDTNIFEDVSESTLGLPHSNKITSPVESQAIQNEMNRKKVLEMIKTEKSKLFVLENEVRKLDIVFSILSEKEMFLIECRYFSNMNWQDIENSYNLKYNKTITEKRLRNKIAILKTKMLEIIKAK